MAEGSWYYCLTHHAVERYDGCKSIDRLGPYDTAEDAARALAKVAERNDAWDNDPRFNDDDDEPRTHDPDEPRPFQGDDDPNLGTGRR